MHRLVTALPLAHTGADWEGLATLATAALGVVFLLVVARVITVRRPHDLVLPVSAAVILSASLPLRAEILHDLSAVALPLGPALLAGLVLVARRRMDSRTT